MKKYNLFLVLAAVIFLPSLAKAQLDNSADVPPTGEDVISSDVFQFQSDLTVGSKDVPGGVDEVSRLQAFLRDQGYNLTPTGYFGSVTKRLLTSFQTTNGLNSTGYLDEATREVINQKFMEAALGETGESETTGNQTTYSRPVFSINYPRGTAASGYPTFRPGGTLEVTWTANNFPAQAKVSIYAVHNGQKNLLLNEITDHNQHGTVEVTLPSREGDGYVLNFIDARWGLVGESDQFSIIAPVENMGDVNGDGKVDIQDALLVWKASTNRSLLLASGRKLADVNQNGQITKRDAYIIMDYAVGYISELPVDKSYVPSCGSTTCVYDEEEAGRRGGGDGGGSSLDNKKASLKITLDSSTPPSFKVSQGEKSVTLMAVKLSANVDDVTVRMIQVGISQYFTPSGNISEYRLYDGGTIVGAAKGLNTESQNVDVPVSLVIPKDSSKVIRVVGDITSSAKGTFQPIFSGMVSSNDTPPSITGAPVTGKIITVVEKPATSGMPSVTITYPTATDTWKTGQNVTIKYNGKNWPNRGKLLFELYKDDGSFVQTIFSGVLLNTGGSVDQGSVGWENVTNGLSATLGAHFKIRVTIYDNSGNIVTSGESGIFSIYSGYTAVPTIKLWADSMKVASGQSTKIYWTTTNAKNGCAGSWDPSYPDASNNTTGVTVYPKGDTTYTLICAGDGGTASASLAVKVSEGATTLKAQAPVPTITKFWSDAPQIVQGGKTKIYWTTTNAYPDNGCVGSWDSSKPDVANNTTGVTVIPSETTTYTLICRGEAGTVTDTLTVSVVQQPPTVTTTSATTTQKTTATATLAPVITKFWADSTSLKQGQSTKIYWTSANTYAENACVGSGDLFGTDVANNTAGITVKPSGSLTYTLICAGPGGQASASLYIGVAQNVLAKLTAEAPEVHVGNLIAGRSVFFGGKIKNNGGTESVPSSAWFLMDYTDVMNSSAIPVGNIAPGQSVEVNAPAWTAKAGTHTVSLCSLNADSSSNGCANYTFTVSAATSYLYKNVNYAGILGTLSKALNKIIR